MALPIKPNSNGKEPDLKANSNVSSKNKKNIESNVQNNNDDAIESLLEAFTGDEASDKSFLPKKVTENFNNTEPMKTVDLTQSDDPVKSNSSDHDVVEPVPSSANIQKNLTGGLPIQPIMNENEETDSVSSKSPELPNLNSNDTDLNDDIVEDDIFSDSQLIKKETNLTDVKDSLNDSNNVNEGTFDFDSLLRETEVLDGSSDNVNDGAGIDSVNNEGSVVSDDPTGNIDEQESVSLDDSWENFEDTGPNEEITDENLNAYIEQLLANDDVETFVPEESLSSEETDNVISEKNSDHEKELNNDDTDFFGDSSEEDAELEEYLTRLASKNNEVEIPSENNNDASVNDENFVENNLTSNENNDEDFNDNLEEEYIPDENESLFAPSFSKDDINLLESNENDEPVKGTRLTGFFDAIKKDLKGETSNDDEKDIDDESKTERKKRKPKNKGPSVFTEVLSPFKKFYMILVNICFNIVEMLLKVLSYIPIINLLVKPLLAATKILRAIALYLPIVFIVGGMFLVSYFSVPKSHAIELPDLGAATFTDFTFDKETKMVSGVITNEGEVIAKVTPVFTVHVLEPTWNPKTWVIPNEVKTCEGSIVNVDIDNDETISVNCNVNIDGFWPRVSGELN